MMSAIEPTRGASPLEEVWLVKRGKAIALVAAGLVAGLVLGSLGIASAVTPSEGTAAETSDAPTWCPGPVWRAGKAIGDAGGRLIDIVSELTGLSVGDVAEKRAAGESFADIAQSEGVSGEDVVDEALKVRKELLDEKVQDGTITRERADEILEHMEARLDERVESTERSPRGRGMGHRAAGGVVRELSDLAGLSPQEILERRQDGESFESIAESKGVTADELIAAVVETAEERVGDLVKDDRITQEQADEMIENLKEHLPEIIESTEAVPEGRGMGRGRMGGGFRGMGGSGSGDGAGPGGCQSGSGPSSAAPMTY